MLKSILKHHTIILASGSPRRQAFFEALDIDVDICLKPVEETYPDTLKHSAISDYLSKLKATPFKDELNSNTILITSDTIVWHNDKALGKPKDAKAATQYLTQLSGNTHDVVTSVCFTTPTKQIVVNDTTQVTFKTLTPEEIHYYITNYKPYDKAGAYGIQDWIGQIGVTQIKGSYFTVMGLPTHLVYKTLNAMVS